MRLCGFVLLILLASVGIGLTGAAPISSNKRGEYLENEVKTELVEENEQEEEDGDQEREVF